MNQRRANFGEDDLEASLMGVQMLVANWNELGGWVGVVLTCFRFVVLTFLGRF